MVKTTLKDVAEGKSVEDIIRAISGTCARLLRAGRNELVVQGLWGHDVKCLLMDTAERLVYLRKRISGSGMDTILSDDEAMLLTDLVYADQEPKADYLADHIGDEHVLECLLKKSRNQIEFHLEDAELCDSSWWECGADESVAADHERLSALKICLLLNDILKDGIKTLLSAGSIDLIYCILSFNTRLRRFVFPG